MVGKFSSMSRMDVEDHDGSAVIEAMLWEAHVVRS
jgi:hypothetical protein